MRLIALQGAVLLSVDEPEQAIRSRTCAAHRALRRRRARAIAARAEESGVAFSPGGE
jgi:hypothetical protein